MVREGRSTSPGWRQPNLRPTWDHTYNHWLSTFRQVMPELEAEVPRWMACFSVSPNQTSTRYVHDPEVGVVGFRFLLRHPALVLRSE